MYCFTDTFRNAKHVKKVPVGVQIYLRMEEGVS
jgi:hypothetical protein